MAIKLVYNALNENKIPVKFQNNEALINITNVVYQGVNNTDDYDIFRTGLSILNNYKPIPQFSELETSILQNTNFKDFRIELDELYNDRKVIKSDHLNSKSSD